MDIKKRPLAVIAVACMYLVVGSIGAVYHFNEALAHPHVGLWDDIWVELTEALAIVAGAWMLQGRNWARWLALAWMAFHVILSAFGPVRELAIHTVICALIAWILFLPVSRQYFCGESEST